MGLLMMDYLRGAIGKTGFGCKSTGEEVTERLDLSSITAIITGGTSGIGAEVARVLVKRGARIVIPARSLRAAESLKESILRENPTVEASNIILFKMDLSSLSSVRSFVFQFLSLDIPLNILINNAGVYCKQYRTSEDGFEMSFATNHLGHFLLTGLLLPKMEETATKCGIEGRIVNVSSCLHSWVGEDGIDFSAINNKERFVESVSYAQSKLANILHAKELARRLKKLSANVSANAVHPGIVRTKILRGDRGGLLMEAILRVASIFMKTIPQGAATICYVATHPDVQGISGKYFVNCEEIECSSAANNMKQAHELWRYSEKATAIC